MPTDSQLLRAFVDQRAEEAFRQLVERHLPLVYRAALRQLNSDTHRAEDVAQTVFIALARQAPALLAHPNLAGWLYTTTYRVTHRVMRTEMRRRKREQAWEVTRTGMNPGPDIWDRIAPQLDDAIRGLATADREVVVLRFFGSRSFAEIGKALGIGEDAARMRVGRAVEKLRHRLAAGGTSVTAAALVGVLDTDAALGAPPSLAAAITHAALQVPATVGFTASIATLMAGTKFIAGSAIVAALAIGIALQQWSVARVAAADVDATRAEIDSVKRTMAGLRAASVATSAKPAAASPVSAANDAWAAAHAPGDAFLGAHPEVREALTNSQRALVRGRYLPLYLELRLSEAQIAEFESLLMSASGAVMPNGDPLFLPPHLRPEERDERLRALLGEEGFARFRAFRSPSERFVQQLAARLVFTAEPLTLRQGAAAREILADARETAGTDGDPWKEALPRLEAVLSRTQMEHLRDIAATDRYQQASIAAGKRAP